MQESLSIPGSGRSPGEGNGNPLQGPCLGGPWGRRSQVGYHPWGHKESDTTEQLNTEGTEKVFRKQSCWDCQDGKWDAAGEKGDQTGHHCLAACCSVRSWTDSRGGRRRGEEGGEVWGKVNKLFSGDKNVTKQGPKRPSENRALSTNLRLPPVCRKTLAP